MSLHQANDESRSKLMPVNLRYPISELIDSCKYYIAKTNRRISFEWALIRNETDTAETAHELGSLLQGMLCHVNVIPLNPTAGFGGKPTPKAGVDEFIRILDTYGITATPRTRRGIDIDAGCGQPVETSRSDSEENIKYAAERCWRWSSLMIPLQVTDA